VSATEPDVLQLRRLVLAVSVLEDLDLEPADDGVVLSAPDPVRVPWHDVSEAIRPHRPDSRTAHRRLTEWLRLRALVAAGGDAPSVLRSAGRALALPPGHPCHPGPQWVQERLSGGALDCGVGLFGLLDERTVRALPPGIASAAGADPAQWWPQLRRHADDMGALAVQRLVRDREPGQQVLRPVGGVDVPTLLLSPVLRRHLAEGDGAGMRSLAVPMRSRGWFDLARIDPAFVGAAWSATAEDDRALPVPLLVTADEVQAAARRGPVLNPLRDPVLHDRWRDDVRYR
jgi:hypothetical protein